MLVGGGCLVALSIEGTPSEPWAAAGGAILPPCPLLPSSSERSHWLDPHGPSCSHAPAGWPSPPGGRLPPYTCFHSVSVLPREGLRPISPSPCPGVAIYQEEASPLVCPQAWTGKPWEQGQMCPHGPAVFPPDAPPERWVHLPLGSKPGEQGGDLYPGPRWVTRDSGSAALNGAADCSDSQRSQAVVGRAEPRCSF